ncbi:sugar-transfer associated ATP-grasp domain-containing protein [Tabrizicola sp.]|uniref:sugar-transfer associated ATP-grasp domain-containing protein n=1 Tax=Tabrizicola sp. TaxID=2005166 RepID=UPI00286CC429|nr:sugar-transfer associated ATP-grasp domain-containing protein [Tabrizicola sp.]
MPTPVSILKTRVAAAPFNLPEAIARTAAMTGRTLPSIAFAVLAAVRKKRGLTAQEYFVQGAWIGDPQERAAFLGGRGNAWLNASMTGARMHDQTALTLDKYLAGLILEANGFPVPKLKAAFAVDRPFGKLPTLDTASALADWIGEAGNLPTFAKPVDGSMALGSVPLQVAGGVEQVDIGGRVVPALELAQEVARAYPRGWLLQELIRQPDEVEALIGPGVGTVRVVTLWEADGPQVMYAVWRHPAVGTWVDAAVHGKPNVGCAVDLATGQVTRVHLGDLFTGREITQSLVTPELALIGFRLPGWQEMVTMCCEAHRLFPGHALLGWDIAMSRRGPVIGEVNASPLHMSYQRAFRRGFLHPDHVTRLDAARALMQRRVAGYDARNKAR